MEIRRIQEKDILECLELLKQLTVVGDNFNYSIPYNIISSNPDYYIYVAEKDEKIVGMATIFIEQKFIYSGSRVGHIEDVVVDSNSRKMNIGKNLIDKCIKTAKLRNCYKVVLDCDEKNIPFYSKCGFEKFGTSMKFSH